ncbi:DUF5105 domain-containing protein [Massilibacterium senegalense]|uniref:DUF5105 domain-containing protein n=1 Tax=Massilibacterium senegalense TaxID=1632858 RepID=UPI000780F69D|nr:DUF5105 domain-containing protein [Massilibacterium senegalense]
MKKLGIFTIFFVMAMALIGCSNEKTGSSKTSSNKLIEVTIEDASYILSGENDGVSEDKDTKKGLLAVDLKIKNKTKEKIIISDQNIKLYDGEEQLSPVDDFNHKIDLEYPNLGEIGGEKVKTVTLIFNVEKDKKYDIGITPLTTDSTDEDEVLIQLDTKKYGKSFDKLDNPAKALTAYIETIYMDKDNVNYEKYVSADKKALQEEAKKLFKEQLQRSFYDIDVPDADVDKQYINYKAALAEKTKIKAVTLANAKGKAVVTLEYSTIPLDLYDAVSNYSDEYKNNTGDYEGVNRENYALSKLDVIISSIEPKESREKLEVEMIEKDGKWTVDTSDEYSSQELMDAFTKGSAF